jgi:hypothetical protein
VRKGLKNIVSFMSENEGIYVCGTMENKKMCMVIVSKDGKLWSTQLDKVLRPDRFLDDFILKHGPLK